VNASNAQKCIERTLKKLKENQEHFFRIAVARENAGIHRVAEEYLNLALEYEEKARQLESTLGLAGQEVMINA
jgi:hypothetical protein